MDSERQFWWKGDDGKMKLVSMDDFQTAVAAIRDRQHDRKVTPPETMQGLGDVLAGATKAVGIKPCAGCQKRQAAMNRATPSYVRRVLAWLRAAPVPRFRPSRRP